MPPNQGAEDFATLVEEHLVALRRYAARQVGARADVVVQQALVRAFRRRRRLGAGQVEPLPWLLILVRERARRDARRHGSGAVAATGVGPDDAALERALASLPPEGREAVDLYYFAGVTVEVAASVLDRDPSGLDADLRSARSALPEDAPDGDVDARLRGYAARWRAGLDELRPAGSPDADAPVLRAGPAVVVLAVAATLVAGLGLWSGWLVPRSEGPEAGAPLGAGSPTTYEPCRDGDLGVAEVRPGRTLHTDYLRVRLRLVGDEACTVTGFPAVVPLEHGRPLPVPVVRRPSDGPVRDLPEVVVQRGRPAVLTLAWSTGRSCPAPDNDRLLITLPGVSRPFAVDGFGRAACRPTTSTGGRTGTLDVFAIRPSAVRYRAAACSRISLAAPPECG